ncbi:MAG: hypothetical protein J6U54_17735 [Clostridiales bacterium]|nr:hypothetical protein [Clostridiales bacterium]
MNKSIEENAKENFEPVEEMVKIRKYLDEHKIEWKDKSDECVCRTHFWIGGWKWSVINGQGTYGGVDICLKPYKNQNLLECWAGPFGEEPAGWLTADDIIKKLKETYKETFNDEAKE